MNRISKEIIEKNNSLLAKKLFNYFSIFAFCYKGEKNKLSLNFLANCDLYCDNNKVLLLFYNKLLQKNAEIIFKQNDLKKILLEKIFFNFDEIYLDSSEKEEKNHYLNAKKKILDALKNSDIEISYQK
ncbi:hypothetical protein JTY60_00510 [symbiont of Argiope bruennichi]|uniref:hypothetical protein n=1 Tax=symbiont of Argiope bruennichi TaxID=2810479 RepID=UPI003DA62DD0